ncbi:MAG TPA: hypothetical protein VLQ93_10635 [Myxococcaceae bacterium]|nr:hypothetical protein [Myxococcaceae bacterium]
MRALLLVLALLSSPVFAARYTVPVDVGVGPAAFVLSGPVFDDQPVHFGLKLNVEAVIDKEWIRKNGRAIPKRYRGMAKNVNEVRISPSLLIPDSFFISPKVRNTGIYGVTWRPVGLMQSVGEGPVRLRLGLGLLLTYAFIHSDVLPTTHFVRPGADLMAELELMPVKSFGLSLGWASGFYVPQKLGSLGVGPLNQSVWHVGQAYLKLHVRFPYEVRR